MYFIIQFMFAVKYSYSKNMIVKHPVKLYTICLCAKLLKLT